MRSSDSTQFHIPKPNNYANSDSSPFNSDESASDDESPQKPMTPLKSPNYDSTTPSSNDSSPTESEITTTFQTRNVTPVTPSKRTRSLITDTSSVSSSSITCRPPITKITITSRSQTSPSNTPLVHIPKPESDERYVNKKQPSAFKTVSDFNC